MSNLALYTTVFPGMEAFVSDWFASVRAQTDRDFDLVIGTDMLTREEVEAAIGERVDAYWIEAPAGSTPADVRDRSWRAIVDDYDAVVFADCDDILWPERIARSRMHLKGAHGVACGLRLVDRDLTPLGVNVLPGSLGKPEEYLFRANDFGLSNTAYRTESLAKCLPLPSQIQAVDWYVATRVMVAGMKLVTDGHVLMDYRQHGNNIAQITRPFGRAFVSHATEIVRTHYDMLLQDETWPAWARDEVSVLRQRVVTFQHSIRTSPERLDAYVEALDQLDQSLVWWACVAHPKLEEIWT